MRSGRAYHAEAAASLCPKLTEYVADRVGHAQAGAITICAAGEEESDRLCVTCIYDQRAGIAAVGEFISGDSDLSAKGLGVLGLTLSTVFKVVDPDAQIDRLNGRAGQSGRPAAFRKLNVAEI
jgi:hypothetical protein